jgi:NADPH:quinone reductase-like Zn-dependent oxidoreductase
VVKPGGVVVTVGGVPDAKFGKAWGLNPVLVLGLRFMMRKVTRLARKVDAHFEYHFVEARGEQLGAIAALLEQGEIKPVLDRTFPFAETRAAIAHVESGRAVGKVVLVADSAR